MKDFSSYLIIIGGIVGTMGLKTPFVSCGVAEEPDHKSVSRSRDAPSVDYNRCLQRSAAGRVSNPRGTCDVFIDYPRLHCVARPHELVK